MQSATRIAIAATLTFASLTLAQAQAESADKRLVVALANAPAVRSPAADEALDAYAGRYVADNGRAFLITVDDDRLMLEPLQSEGFVLATLHAVDAASFESYDGAIRVWFELGADGEVSGASISGVDALEVATTRSPFRGIVTIIDCVDDVAACVVDAPAARLSTRGVVTIHDVTTSGITAAN